MQKIATIPQEVTTEEKLTMLESLKNSQNELNFLKKSSKALINSFELLKIFWSLKEGESIVINSNGTIFKGKVKTEKLNALPEIFAGKKDTSLDDMETQKYFNTKSFVNSPSTGFKNAWDSQMIKPPKESDSILGDSFLLALDFSTEENIKVTDNYTDSNGFKYYIVELIKNKMKGYFTQKTKTLRMVEFNGKLHNI